MRVSSRNRPRPRRKHQATPTDHPNFNEFLGEQQEALDFFNQALPIYQAVGDRRYEANTLSNIGLVYSALGEQQKALDFYNQALQILRAVGDRGGEAGTLNNIGTVYSALGTC